MWKMPSGKNVYIALTHFFYYRNKKKLQCIIWNLHIIKNDCYLEIGGLLFDNLILIWKNNNCNTLINLKFNSFYNTYKLLSVSVKRIGFFTPQLGEYGGYKDTDNLKLFQGLFCTCGFIYFKDCNSVTYPSMDF